MRVLHATLLCLLFAGCAAQPAPDKPKVAMNCRAADAPTGSHLVRKDECVPANVSEEETQRRVEQIQQEQQRMNLPRPGAGGR